MGTKTTDLGAIVTVSIADVFPIVDVSDNTQAPSGSTKKITITQLKAKFTTDGFLSSGDNISALVNDSGYITSADFSNGGEAATANRDLGNTDAFALSFITNGVGRINILSTGEVGFGMSVPTEQIEVTGNIKTNGFQSIGTTISSVRQLNVFGSSPTNNSAIYGQSEIPTGGVESAGIEGVSIANGGDESTNHYGVRGRARNGSTKSYGIWGQVEAGATIVSSETIGVYGFNQASNGTTNKAIYGKATVTSGTGIAIDAEANGSATTNIGIRIRTANGGTNYALVTDGNNVGLGTLTPTEALEVVGSIKMVDGNQALNKVLTSDANGVGSWEDQQNGIFTAANSGSTVPIGFDFELTNTMTINSAGGLTPIAVFNNTGVEIGNPVGGAGLTVNSSSVNPFTVSRNGLSMLEVTYNGANPTLRMYDINSVQRVNINSESFAGDTWFNNLGNFGIGTAAPSVKLEVVGNALITSGELTITNPQALKLSHLNGRFNIGTTADTNTHIFVRGTRPTLIDLGDATTSKFSVDANGQTIINHTLGSGTAFRVDRSGETFALTLRSDDGNVGIGVGNTPSTKLEVGGGVTMNSTTELSKVLPITAAQASLVTPANGNFCYVTTTDATFTSIGFWKYENGAWVAW